MPGVRVIFFPYLNNLGHVVPNLALARALKAAGHKVGFRGSGRYADAVTSAGFNLAPCWTFDEAWNRRQQPWMKQWTPEIIEQACAAEREALAEDQPDVVVADYRPTLGITARQAGVPLVALLCADWTNHHRLPDAVPSIAGMPQRIFTPITAAEHAAAKGRFLRLAGRDLKRAYEAAGVPLPGEGNLFDAWSGDLSLLNDIPELSPLEGQPEGLHYIGPQLYPIAPPDLPPRPEGQTLIYATLGTTGATGEWDPVTLMTEALGGRFAVWLTTGGQFGTRSCDAATEGVEILKVIDGCAAAEAAAVTVCTGGSGTVYQSLLAGTPLICLPRNHNQWYVGHRVVTAGAGLMLTGEVDPPRLRAAVDQVISTPAFTERARALGKAARQRLANIQPAALIEALVAERAAR